VCHALDARNQLPGRVTAVRLGAVMAEITIDLGGPKVVAAITRQSAESLGCVKGTRSWR
jgi:molybdate transport system regulatory protein